MRDYSKVHTFVICAYKESEYLEEAIISLKKQKVKSRIMIATSTDNNYIRHLADKYDLEVRVNSAKQISIGKDFNFALSVGKTDLVTVVHQDDKYKWDYSENVIREYQENPDALIFFTDYMEIRDGKTIQKSRLLRIKRLLLSPLKINDRMRYFKRMVISLGNPILCPSVTFNMNKTKLPVFDEHYKSNVDWYAWEKLSREKGRFVYIPKKLSYHRIHNGQETVRTINDKIRTKEDYEMLRKFWPKSIAKMINRVYQMGEDYYK